MLRLWTLCLLLGSCISYPYNGLSIDPEVYMNTTGLITSKGFPCENHYVTTDDGFILNMQRIPHGHSGDSSAAPKRVVLLQHGLGGSSNNFVLNPANESLAFVLADAGADVWLGNNRGNKYSRAHKTLKPSDDKFWKWSWDEMARYDLPAMIDYILQTTGQTQLTYVGHSQGTMIGFAGFSRNKTLGQMVKTFVALAPVAKVRHIKSPIRLLAPFTKDLKFFDRFGHGEFMASSNLTAWLAKDVCQGVPALCADFFFVSNGVDFKALNMSRVPVYVSHTPDGTSVQNMMHFGQGVNKDAFQMYDYGSDKANFIHYNQTGPPPYWPALMEVPTVLFRGGRDFMADPEDVSWLKPQIQNLVGDHYIEHWEHLDFILAMDSVPLCYNEIKRIVFS